MRKQKEESIDFAEKSLCDNNKAMLKSNLKNLSRISRIINPFEPSVYYERRSVIKAP